MLDGPATGSDVWPSSLSLKILRGEGRVASEPSELYFDELINVEVRFDPGSNTNVADVDIHFRAQVVTPHDGPIDDNELIMFEGTLASEPVVDSSSRTWTTPVHIKNSRSREGAHLELACLAIRHEIVSDIPEKSRYLESLVPVGANNTFGLLGSFGTVGEGAVVDLEPTVQTSDPSRSRSTSRVSHTSHCSEPGLPSPPAVAVVTVPPNGPKPPRPSKNDQEIARKVVKVPLVQVIEMGLRSVRPVLEKDRVIAQLDINTLPRSILLSELEIKMHQGKVQAASPLGLPLLIQDNSGHAFCFNMETLNASSQSISSRTEVLISYYALDPAGPGEAPDKVGASPHPSTPVLETSWVSTVDFQDAAGPLPKTPTLGTLPSPNLPRTSSNGSLASLVSSMADQRTANVWVPLGGVTMFLTGPNNVKLGSVFEWKVVVINKASRARKLALSFSPKEAGHLLTSKHERALVSNLETLQRRVESYQAVVGHDSGIIPLMSELKIGLLAPMSCFETNIRLLAVAPGRHAVETSTVLDLTTGDLYDTGELLDVTVDH